MSKPLAKGGIGTELGPEVLHSQSSCQAHDAMWHDRTEVWYTIEFSFSTEAAGTGSSSALGVLPEGIRPDFDLPPSWYLCVLLALVILVLWVRGEKGLEEWKLMQLTLKSMNSATVPRPGFGGRVAMTTRSPQGLCFVMSLTSPSPVPHRYQTTPQDRSTDNCSFFDFPFHGVIAASAAGTVTLARTSAGDQAPSVFFWTKGRTNPYPRLLSWGVSLTALLICDNCVQHQNKDF